MARWQVQFQRDGTSAQTKSSRVSISPSIGLFYEHFGLNTPEYLQSAEAKIRSYQQAGIPFMYTTFDDETDIEDVIVDKLALATLEL